jgi:AbrB family looped-hinge helix DNA binding protein
MSDQSDFTKMVEAQMEAFRRLSTSQASAMNNFLGSLQALTNVGAVFKTTVQKAGRISIPEAERTALGINEGDLVQVMVIPIKRSTQKP